MLNLLPDPSMPAGEPRIRRRHGFLIRVLLAGFPALVALPVHSEAEGAASLTLHAEGVQIYECKAGTDGNASWAFREPLATLLDHGKTVGRHFAGPSWEAADRSAVVGKVIGQTAGQTKADIAWLKLEVADHLGAGIMSDVKAIERVNTRGGAFSGSCAAPGSFHEEPYSADYIFTRG